MRYVRLAAASLLLRKIQQPPVIQHSLLSHLLYVFRQFGIEVCRIGCLIMVLKKSGEDYVGCQISSQDRGMTAVRPIQSCGS